MSLDERILIFPEPLRPGGLEVVARDGVVVRVRFLSRQPSGPRAAPGAGAEERDAGSRHVGSRQVLELAKDELERYFAGEPVRFRVPLRPDASASPFRRAVWEALRKIPHGTTVSYGELATRVGCPGGARAVGGAVGSNPLPVFLPCHRVVAETGRLTGFSSGLPLKVRLLELEGITVGSRSSDVRRWVVHA